jgi:4-nitrophenyl phosphatase
MQIEACAQRIRRSRAVFLDWDGCVSQDGALLPGAARFLNHVGDRTWILSNNSTDIPQAFVDLLANGGVRIGPERILLAGEYAVALVAARSPESAVHMVAGARMKALARRRGLILDAVGDSAEVVLLLRDTRFSYARLNRAVAALRRGAQLVVANTDRTHPSGHGVVPETGALLAAIAACVDLSKVDVEIVGKPSPLMFDHALKLAGVTPDEAIMIGDNPETDVAGAERMGIPAICLSPADGITLAALADALDGYAPSLKKRAAR